MFSQVLQVIPSNLRSTYTKEEHSEGVFSGRHMLGVREAVNSIWGLIEP